jgi:hypothetical protein
MATQPLPNKGGQQTSFADRFCSIADVAWRPHQDHAHLLFLGLADDTRIPETNPACHNPA